MDKLHRLIGRIEILPTVEQYEKYKVQGMDLNGIANSEKIKMIQKKDRQEFKTVKARINYYNKNIDQFENSSIFSIAGNNRVEKAILYSEYEVTVNAYVSKITNGEKTYYKLESLEDCRKISSIERSLVLFSEDQKNNVID